MQKKITMIGVLLAMAITGDALAWKQKEEACSKPMFRKFSPPRLSEVEPGSKFSFTVYVHSGTIGSAQVGSGRVHIDSLEATVKKIKVDLDIEDRNSFLKVSGTLPPSLSNTYARISLKAFLEKLNGHPDRNCRTQDGWLVKISGPKTAAADKKTAAETAVAAEPAQPADNDAAAAVESPEPIAPKQPQPARPD